MDVRQGLNPRQRAEPAHARGNAQSGKASGAKFAIMAYTLCVIMAGATLASPLYPLYESAFHMGPGGVSVAYTTYMAGTLLALLFLGHLSDHFGHIRTLIWATSLAIAGLALCGVAPGLAALAVGRLAIGVAAGIASTAATAGLVAVSTPQRITHASSIGALMTIVGLGLGPLVAGVVAQFLPAPLHVPYLVFGAALALALIVLLWHRHDMAPGANTTFIPRMRFLLPDAQHLRSFLVVAVLTFVGYTLFSIFASLAPSFVNTYLPWHGPAAGGIGVAMLFAGSAAAQLTLRGSSPRKGIFYGALMVILALAMLALSIVFASGFLFIASDLLGGFGQGLAFMSALFFVNTVTTSERRSGMIASFFTIAYTGGIVPVLALGLASSQFGLDRSLIALCAALIVLTGSLALVSRRQLQEVTR
ncbi:MFS transporter [Paraburkholderia sp. J67]|uniref:MFS transporter n=1 Tax=Paraburkholderia sp. J67 TaxID=2805435 RepID=UPI002ABE2888|nr:MFS transporter [Paraburkholderia sp. J67]